MSEVIPENYRNFNAFFTRALKKSCRPIDPASDALVSPVDGVIGCFGNIAEGTLLQAKGISYPLAELVHNKDYLARFQGGDYLTIYLSPRHYHRIHSPASGEIQELYYIPGALYPVNNFAVSNIPSLFTLNERLITIVDVAKFGQLAVIKVGATIVGKIKVVYDSVESNVKQEIIHNKYDSLSIQKGSELGRFQMGSTVILLFQPGQITFEPITQGQEIKYGERIAQYCSIVENR